MFRPCSEAPAVPGPGGCLRGWGSVATCSVAYANHLPCWASVLPLYREGAGHVALDVASVAALCLLHLLCAEARAASLAFAGAPPGANTHLEKSVNQG